MSVLIIVGIAVAVLAVVGVGLALRNRSVAGSGPAHLPGPPRAMPSGGLASLELGSGKAVLDPKPNQIQPGDELGLRRGTQGEPTMYTVTAGAHFQEPDDEDEHWTEFELERVMDNQVFFLEYDRDDEHRWVWILSRKLKASDLDMELAFTDLGMGKKEKPPEELQWGGRLWKVISGSHHYKVNVTDWRIDRPETHSYLARFSDYREMGGDDELSLEVWDGGYGLTVKEGKVDEVTLVKR
jgi:hypothetical protein